MLPPPTTIPIWTPSALTWAIWRAIVRQNSGIDPVLAVAEEGLAGQLEQDPPVADRLGPGGRSRNGRPGLAHSSSPSSKRTNRRTRMFSPIVAIASMISSRTETSVSRNG